MSKVALPFRTFGILDKATFDKLHGLIFLEREIEFHTENLKQPAKDKIPEEKYNEVTDREGVVIEKRDEKTKEQIAKLKSEGLELKIK